MYKKQTIKLNESQLRKIVSESVKRVLINERLGKVLRKYSIGGERYVGNDAETVDRAKGDTTPNKIIEYSKYNLTYSNKDGYVIRIDSESGTVFASKEPGGRSYHEGPLSIAAFLAQDNPKFTNQTLGTLRDLSSANIPDEMLVTSKVLAFKIVTWIKLVVSDNYEYSNDLTQPSTWLSFN